MFDCSVDISVSFFGRPLVYFVWSVPSNMAAIKVHKTLCLLRETEGKRKQENLPRNNLRETFYAWACAEGAWEEIENANLGISPDVADV